MIGTINIRIAAIFVGLMAGVLPGLSRAERITIAALPTVASAPLFIAEEKGYYAEQGLDVEFQYFDAAGLVAKAVAQGKADFGVTGLTAEFYALAGKGALRIIGAQSRVEPGFNYVAYIASSRAYNGGLKNVDRLKGRKIGMTAPGSTTHYMAGMLAEQMGWRLKSDLKLVPLQNRPNVIDAVGSGKVDAALLPGSIAADLENLGKARVIGWVKDYTPWQLGVLFTSTKLIQNSRRTVEKFVIAYQLASSDYFKAFMLNRDKKLAKELVDIIHKYTRLDRRNIRAGLPFMDPMGRLMVRDIYDQIEWHQENKLLRKSVSAKQIMDLSFIDGHMDIPSN